MSRPEDPIDAAMLGLEVFKKRRESDPDSFRPDNQEAAQKAFEVCERLTNAFARALADEKLRLDSHDAIIALVAMLWAATEPWVIAAELAERFDNLKPSGKPH